MNPDPKQVVEEIYARFGLDISEEFDQFLDDEREAAKTFRSQHEYDPKGQGPARERIERELGDLFERFDWARQVGSAMIQ